jgi:hypothetical protein
VVGIVARSGVWKNLARPIDAGIFPTEDGQFRGQATPELVIVVAVIRCPKRAPS